MIVVRFEESIILYTSFSIDYLCLNDQLLFYSKNEHRCAINITVISFALSQLMTVLFRFEKSAALVQCIYTHSYLSTFKKKKTLNDNKKMTVVLTELIQRPKQAASLSQQRIFLKSSFIFFFLCVLLERKWNEQYLCYRIFLCRLNFLFCSPFWMLDEPQSKCPAKTRLGTFIFCALSLSIPFSYELCDDPLLCTSSA